MVLIDTVGAYGRSMASTYNLRDPGPEVIVTDDCVVISGLPAEAAAAVAGAGKA